MTARRSTLALGGATALVVLAAAPAAAEQVDMDLGANQEDGAISSSAGGSEIVWDHSQNGSGANTGPLATISPTWSPPPCWYAPLWGAEEFKEWFEDAWDLDSANLSAGHSGSAAAEMWRLYEGGGAYHDFNLGEEGNGMFWGRVQNENNPDEAGRWECSELPFWVENGEQPEVENAVSPEILAELAYEEIRVPQTEISLSPADLDAQVVSLPTWIWADAGDLQEVAVTASLDNWPISATTTARPASLTIGAGTEYADLHPRSGECAINSDGSVGEPYARGRSGETPPCGLTYLRATQQDSYPLTADITWEVSWEGSGGSGGPLPDAVLETTHGISVQEIQAVVR